METLQRTANRGSVSTGYDVTNSLKVESDNNEYLERPTGGSDGSSTKHTISVWVKRTELGVDSEPVSAGGIGRFRFESDDTFNYQFRSGKELITTRVFRDTSAWYHIVAAADSSQATASNRMKLYVNGVQVTDFGTANYQDQDQASPAWGKNTTYSLRVGAAASSTRNFNGYIAEMYYIDGQTLDPTSFGEFDSNTGIWKPKKFSGTYGSLDTYLDFKDSSNLGNNVTGGTDMNANNITVADQATDTCTNNFCTWVSDGTLFNSGTDNMTFSEGGTRILTRAGTGWTAVYPTQSFAGGKWYMEVKVNENSATNMYGAMPVTRINSLRYQEYHHGQDVDGSIGIYANNGQIYWGTAGSGGSGSALSAGDIVGLAIDMENYKMYFAVNNTYVESGNPAGNSNGRDINQEPYVFSVCHYTTTTVEDTNFGGYTALSNTHTNTDDNDFGNFIYAPPSGFLAVCTKNLATTGG